MESETEPRYRFDGQLLAVGMMSAISYFPESHRALMRRGGGGVGGVGAAVPLVLCEVVVNRSRA